MHPAIFDEFDRICRDRGVSGAVLEIGAVPEPHTLLCLPSLAGAAEKVGLNLDGPHRYRDFTILQGDANRMDAFPDRRFDAILCNAMLEHDPFFWRTLSEIRRVGRPGALVVIGVPGYGDLKGFKRAMRWSRRLLPVGGELRRTLRGADSATLTLHVHNFPGDYYRFSDQAVEQVFFAGMHSVEVVSRLVPPRIIGCGHLA